MIKEEKDRHTYNKTKKGWLPGLVTSCVETYFYDYLFMKR